jgi:hypothetical protein
MRAAGFAAIVAMCFVPAFAAEHTSEAGGVVEPTPLAVGTRALTDLDDARACLPLPGGGLAVATGGGLALVGKDGRVRTLTALDGLPDTRVHALAADGDTLWVGTDAGAAQVTLGPEPAVRRAVAVDQAPVHAVLATSTGVYLGTWGAGLLRVSGHDAAAEVVPTAGGGERIAALAEYRGSLYVAYADGPAARLAQGKAVAIVDAPAHGQALLATTEGRPELVLGDLEGVFRLDDGATPIAPFDARGLAQGPGGALLVATYGSGLLAGPLHGALRPEASVPRFVNGIAAGGGVRCAATTEGVFVQVEGQRYERVALGTLPSNDITVVAEDGGGRVAVGTFDRGAAIVEGGRVSPVPGLEPTEAINAAAWQEGGDGSALWLATAHGVVRVAPRAVPRRLRAADGLPSSFVRALLVQPDGRVLVGTDEGAAWIEGDRVVAVAPRRKGGPVPLASPMHATWALAVSADGAMWLGTNVGLYVGKGGSFRRVALATGDLKDDWVTALAVRGDDVFVGTYAGGVTHLHASHLGGITGDHVHLGGGCINPGGLTFVGDQLFAATMEGLLARPAGDDHAAWTLRPAAAPGRDVTSVRKVGDTLWVASRRGIGMARF